MANNVSKIQIQNARQTHLYNFLIKYHANDIIREGDSIRLKNNHSISMKQNYCGYKDFANDESGNSIEFLTIHMGYSFISAVQALTGETSAVNTPSRTQNRMIAVPPKFPLPINEPYKNLYAFLTNRGISTETIQILITEKILYQEKAKNNIVFINRERNFAELRGTYTYGKPFHGMVPNCRHDGFWWFRTSKNAVKAYICEAAIDTISLYELHKMRGNNEPAYYISIAGAGKQPAINRLKCSKLNLILAVDNDKAGQQCRDRNSDLEYTLPERKDWNDDLQARETHSQ